MTGQRDGILTGMGVLLTRPAGQGQRSTAALRDAGARVYEFPALEIEAIASAPALDAVLRQVPRADWLIFVSVNAVEYGMPHVDRHAGNGIHARVAAIGHVTRDALLEKGVSQVISPESGNDSEALLAHPDLQRVAGQHFIIFRGQSAAGGRKLLGETLAQRGALIHYAECYARRTPQAGAESLARLLECWERGEIHAVHVMSAETLHNLVFLIGARGKTLLRNTAVVTPHERIAGAASALGCVKVLVAGLNDTELIDCLARLNAQDWGNDRRKDNE